MGRYYKTVSIDSVPAFIASEVGLRTIAYEFSNSGLSADDEGKIIIEGGTVYPSNDANAVGIVFEDVDVTDGDFAGSLIVGGYIYENRLPDDVESAAKAVLTNITFEDAPSVTR